ncbi:hypothetical protein D9613_009728 [Agrocybe pediades]|uniref:Uncharacterized protein n=1 Tax=Agrocybe pediades TaxID=84607 RepID=A0A8H4VPV8_9AGAR|nr:hypothetical protein D9613_009728 [Agrocybe pediades]
MDIDAKRDDNDDKRDIAPSNGGRDRDYDRDKDRDVRDRDYDRDRDRRDRDRDRDRRDSGYNDIQDDQGHESIIGNQKEGVIVGDVPGLVLALVLRDVLHLLGVADVLVPVLVPVLGQGVHGLVAGTAKPTPFPVHSAVQ